MTSCLLWFTATFCTCLPARTSPQNPVLDQAAIASRKTSSLSADILLTWHTGGVTRQAHGTIRLQRPNLARIVLQGSYPELLLVSDGRTRFLAPTETQYQTSAMDAAGLGIDSPWWGLPFRYFFTQSVNPFGATPDPNAIFKNATSALKEPARWYTVSVQGMSPMGGYTERLSFDSDGDLIASSVQFGEGANGATFDASLSHIRHQPIDAQTFRFKPAHGQLEAANTDTMLPLQAPAPAFSLPAVGGKTVSLADLRRGRKAVLLNFWYYNCAPCRIEFPAFEMLYERFSAQGFNVVAIDRADSPEVVSDYVKKTGLTFTMLMGGEVSKNFVFSKYKVTDSFPGSYLLDENGKVIYRSAGGDLDGLKKALAQLGFK